MSAAAAVADRVRGLVDRRCMLHLSGAEVGALGVFDFPRNVRAVERAYLAHHRGRTAMPHADYLRYPGRSSYDRVITLLGHVGDGDPVTGLKVICSSTTNAPRGFARASGLILLIDPDTQRTYAVMEAAQISAARTAAVTGLAIERLGPERLDKVGFLGSGYLAKTHLRMLASLHRSRLGAIHVFDPDAAAVASFETLAVDLGLSVKPEADAESVVREADLIVPVTTEERPYVEADWIREGSLYSAVSLLDPKLEVIRRSDAVVVDDACLCLKEGRPLQKLADRGDIDPAGLLTLGRIVSEDLRPRRHGPERIFFNPMGTVMTDLVVARSIFREALERGIGRQLPF